MKKYGLLNKEQIEEYVGFLYKDNEPNITDFAIAMGARVNLNEDGVHGMIGYDKNFEGMTSHELDKLPIVDEDDVLYIEKFFEGFIRSEENVKTLSEWNRWDSYVYKSVGSQRVIKVSAEDRKFLLAKRAIDRNLIYIPWLSTDFLPENQKIDMIDDRYGVTYFGKFPQKRFRISKDEISNLKKQSPIETFCFQIGHNKNAKYYSPIYTYFAKRAYKNNKVGNYVGHYWEKIILYNSRPFNAKEFLDKDYFGKGEKIEYGEEYGFIVSDIKWIVDKKNKIMFPDKGLFSGYCLWDYFIYPTTKNTYFNIKDSEIYMYLENCFIPNILGSNSLSKIYDEKYDKFVAGYEQKVIENAKEKAKQELHDFYSKIEEEILEKLFDDNEQKLANLSNKICNNAIEELHKIIEDAIDGQTASFNEELEKTSRKLSDKINNLKTAIESKDGVIEYAEKELDNLIEKYVLELDNKLNEQISLLEKSRNEIILQLSNLIKDNFISIKNEFDVLSGKINAEISKLERKKQEFANISSNVDRELERIAKERRNLESQITNEVIRQVVELNPVKEVSVTIDDVKKKGIKGLFHKDFEAVLQLVSLKMPIFLVGPAGCGKNVILKQCSEVLGKKFYYQNDADEQMVFIIKHHSMTLLKTVEF